MIRRPKYKVKYILEGIVAQFNPSNSGRVYAPIQYAVYIAEPRQRGRRMPKNRLS